MSLADENTSGIFTFLKIWCILEVVSNKSYNNKLSFRAQVLHIVYISYKQEQK